MSWSPASTGTVTSVSVVNANGLSGTVATASTTPAITLSTTVTGMLKGNGTAITAGTPGTDYSAGTSALGTGILKSTTATGALSIASALDFPTLNQNTTGNAATATTATNFSGSLSGDVSGTQTSTSVDKIKGNTVPVNAAGVLTNNGTGTLTWSPSGSGTGVNYNIPSASAQTTATTGDELFDVEYPSGGVASSPGAVIKSINSGSAAATGLTVSATGGTANTAIAALFTPGASSIGETINGTVTATTGSIGIFVGGKQNSSFSPDIAAKLEGVTTDLFTAGGLSSTAAAPAYSIKLAGSATDNTNHSGAAIGITGADYPNGIFAQGSVSGVYGATSATTVITVDNADYDFENGPFSGSFGVRGEATGEPSPAARLIGVWGLASGNSGVNTKSIGVLAQGGNGETSVGETNVALNVELGELTMGMTSNPNHQNGTGVTTVNTSISEGPSGMVKLATGFAANSQNTINEQDFTVGNEYCSASSIIIATVQNDPDAGNSSYTVQAVAGSTGGSFTIVLTQHVLNNETSTATPTVNVGYIIVNPSR